MSSSPSHPASPLSFFPRLFPSRRAQAHLKAASEGEETVVPDQTDDLELVWELLESARAILVAHPSKANDLLQAEVLSKIGDVSMESDNFAQSYEDYSKCLDLQQKCLGREDKQIAITHTNLACASLYNENVEKVRCCFCLLCLLLI